jgi:hypothetical protein
MRLLKYLFYLFVLTLFYSCADSSHPSAEQDQKPKVDSTVIIYEGHVSALAQDSSLVNINKCIRFALNDSIRNQWVSIRRSMYTRQESFQKLKVDPEEVIKVNPCYSPILFNIDRIHDEHYTWQDLFNESFDKNDYKSSRYVVGDFNTKDAQGNCKGCQEEFPNIWELPELKDFLKRSLLDKIDLYDNESLDNWLNQLNKEERVKWNSFVSLWKNLRDHVESYRTDPLKKDPIIEIGGKQYCIGQRLCLCEIQGDTIIKVAQFVTSSKNAMASQNNQRDFDGQRRYYAPLNRLSTRYWDDHLPYDSLDKKRDDEMGFASRHVITYKGTVPLPNFMHITPDDAFPGAKGFVNGIHEFAVGGNVPGRYMGTPVSLGCVRLHDYPSKFMRWWTPANAKMFIHYEDKRYQQYP